jgi:hypothetical protein
VVAVLALTGAALFIVVGLVAAARIVHIGNLDAMALAEKLAAPYPACAADWPELAVRAVVQQPGEPATVLLLVDRPGHDGSAVTLLIRLDGPVPRSVRLLEGWCRAGSSISPRVRLDAQLELRRRQSLERVRGRLLAEESPSARETARS